MNSQKLFWINKTSLELIGNNYMEKNVLSPLNKRMNSTISNDYNKEKLELILSQNNEMFEKLAMPTIMSRFRMDESLIRYEFHSYFESTGKLIANMITGEENNVCFSTDKDIQEYMDIIKEFTGYSSLKNINIQNEFRHNEAVIIFAIIDLYRKEMFNMIGQRGVELKTDFSISDIEKELTEQEGLSNVWLGGIAVKILKDMGIDMQMKVVDLVVGLLDKGLLVKKDDRYSLSDGLEAIVPRLVLPDYICSLFCGCNEEGYVNYSYSIGMQFGNRDIIVLGFNNEGIELFSLNGKEWIELINKYLTEPEKILN